MDGRSIFFFLVTIFFNPTFQPSSDGHPGAHIDFAKKRLQLAESLFYKVLENILLSERRRLGGNGKTGFQVQITFYVAHIRWSTQENIFIHTIFQTKNELINLLKNVMNQNK